MPRRRSRRAPTPVRAADLTALTLAVRLGRLPIGVALSRASVLADHGVLWPVLGAALLPARATRLAGAAGIAAVAGTSTLTNGLKVVVRRRRPPLPLRIGAPRIGRDPTTSSFPSGHTASACAFGIAATVIQPLLGIALAPLAAAVAASRLTTARHHPSDVVAGAAIGCAVGTAVGLLSRRVGRRRARREPGPAD